MYFIITDECFFRENEVIPIFFLYGLISYVLSNISYYVFFLYCKVCFIIHYYYLAIYIYIYIYFISEFCQSTSCHRRMLFLSVCSLSIELLPHHIFKEHFSTPMIAMHCEYIYMDKIIRKYINLFYVKNENYLFFAFYVKMKIIYFSLSM